MQPRPLDHLVLPTHDLAVARARLTALGFTVAPEGVHPFGTKNCCVYFADGTFLEPLAQGDERLQREAARLGNVFAARDLAYRYRRGEEGFSAVVFGTSEAIADHAGFVETGYSAGSMLDFSRDFVDASGQVGRASFKLAFSADLRTPDLFCFTCQRVGVPKVDRSALQRHANGVAAISQVVLTGPRPADFTDFISGASNASPQAGQTEFRLPNSSIRLTDAAAIAAEFGAEAGSDPGLLASALLFSVGDLAATEATFQQNSVDYQSRGGRLIVPPAPGQGAIFAFEAL